MQASKDVIIDNQALPKVVQVRLNLRFVHQSRLAPLGLKLYLLRSSIVGKVQI